MLKASYANSARRPGSEGSGHCWQSRQHRNPHGSIDHGLSPAGRGLAVAVIAWSLAWKGASLWRASKEDSKPWFVTLLLANTAGILDAVYLFGVSGAHRRKRYDEKSILSTTGEPEQLGRSQET
jgi:hypothetical protein